VGNFCLLVWILRKVYDEGWFEWIVIGLDILIGMGVMFFGVIKIVVELVLFSGIDLVQIWVVVSGSNAWMWGLLFGFVCFGAVVDFVVMDVLWGFIVVDVFGVLVIGDIFGISVVIIDGMVCGFLSCNILRVVWLVIIWFELFYLVGGH